MLIAVIFFDSSFGNARLDSNSPDTITSWVLSGFAVSNLTGFGVANEKQQVATNYLSIQLNITILGKYIIQLTVVGIGYSSV